MPLPARWRPKAFPTPLPRAMPVRPARVAGLGASTPQADMQMLAQDMAQRIQAMSSTIGMGKQAILSAISAIPGWGTAVGVVGSLLSSFSDARVQATIQRIVQEAQAEVAAYQEQAVGRYNAARRDVATQEAPAALELARSNATLRLDGLAGIPATSLGGDLQTYTPSYMVLRPEAYADEVKRALQNYATHAQTALAADIRAYAEQKRALLEQRSAAMAAAPARVLEALREEARIQGLEAPIPELVGQDNIDAFVRRLQEAKRVAFAAHDDAGRREIARRAGYTGVGRVFDGEDDYDDALRYARNNVGAFRAELARMEPESNYRRHYDEVLNALAEIDAGGKRARWWRGNGAGAFVRLVEDARYLITNQNVNRDFAAKVWADGKRDIDAEIERARAEGVANVDREYHAALNQFGAAPDDATIRARLLADPEVQAGLRAERDIAAKARIERFFAELERSVLNDDQVREWATARGGAPAAVNGLGSWLSEAVDKAENAFKDAWRSIRENLDDFKDSLRNAVRSAVDDIARGGMFDLGMTAVAQRLNLDRLIDPLLSTLPQRWDSVDDIRRRQEEWTEGVLRLPQNLIEAADDLKDSVVDAADGLVENLDDLKDSVIDAAQTGLDAITGEAQIEDARNKARRFVREAKAVVDQYIDGLISDLRSPAGRERLRVALAMEMRKDPALMAADTTTTNAALNKLGGNTALLVGGGIAAAVAVALFAARRR